MVSCHYAITISLLRQNLSGGMMHLDMLAEGGALIIMGGLAVATGGFSLIAVGSIALAMGGTWAGLSF